MHLKVRHFSDRDAALFLINKFPRRKQLGIMKAFYYIYAPKGRGIYLLLRASSEAPAFQERRRIHQILIHLIFTRFFMTLLSKTILVVVAMGILFFQPKRADSQGISSCPDSCSVPGPELVMNGDFNQVIQNSSYTSSVPFLLPIWASNIMMNFGEYYVTNDAALHNLQWSGFDCGCV